MAAIRQINGFLRCLFKLVSSGQRFLDGENVGARRKSDFRFLFRHINTGCGFGERRNGYGLRAGFFAHSAQQKCFFVNPKSLGIG